MEQNASGRNGFAGIHDGERINCAQCGSDPRGELAALTARAVRETSAGADGLEALAAPLAALGDEALAALVRSAALSLRAALARLAELPGGRENESTR